MHVHRAAYPNSMTVNKYVVISHQSLDSAAIWISFFSLTSSSLHMRFYTPADDWNISVAL